MKNEVKKGKTKAAAKVRAAVAAGSDGAEIRRVRVEAEEIVRNADEVKRIADRVAQGGEQQRRTLEGIVSGANQMTASLKETAEQAVCVAASSVLLVAGINEMAASIEEVAAISENLAGNIEAVSTSIEEANRSIQGAAVNAEKISAAAAGAVAGATQLDRSLRSAAGVVKHAEETTRRVSRDADEGGGAVEKSIASLGRVRESMSQSAAVIKEMGKRANEIGSIVDTINLIAERTNLLSLNASIEAARAGEHGRGFSVVAEEVRKLAEQSTRSAEAIGRLAESSRRFETVMGQTFPASLTHLPPDTVKKACR